VLRRATALMFAVVASAALAVGGCGTYLPPAPLDDSERAELESLRVAFADRTILVPEQQSKWEPARGLRAAGFNVRAVPEGDPAAGPRIELTGTSGGPLHDPWGTIFGVFVIPVWTNATSLHFRISDGAREVPCECPVGVPMVYGWLALPLRLLPRWKGWGALLPPQWDEDAQGQRIALTIARSLVAVEAPE